MALGGRPHFDERRSSVYHRPAETAPLPCLERLLRLPQSERPLQAPWRLTQRDPLSGAKKRGGQPEIALRSLEIGLGR